MLRLECSPNLPAARWDGCDFLVLSTERHLDAVKTGKYAHESDGSVLPVRTEFTDRDVLTVSTHWGPCEGFGPDYVGIKEPCRRDIEEIRDKWPGRICVANEGGELSCRKAVGLWDWCKSSEAMRAFAAEAYDLVGSRLVLSPIPYDLCQDVRCYAKLMEWCAEKGVPLLMWCGFWFCLSEAEKRINKSWDYYIPMAFVGRGGWIFPRPFREVSDAIKRTGVEMWSGVGWVDGMKLGMMERLEAFGFKGGMTNRACWEGTGISA